MKRTSAFVVVALLFGCVDLGLVGPAGAGPDPDCSVVVGGGDGQQQEWENCVSDLHSYILEQEPGLTYGDVCETEPIRNASGRVTGFHVHCDDF